MTIGMSLTTKPLRQKSKPPRGSRLKYSFYPPNQQPSLRLILNEGVGNPKDIINNFIITPSNILSWVNSPKGVGITLPSGAGVTDYIGSPTFSLSGFPSLGVWFYATASSINSTIISYGSPTVGSGANEFSIFMVNGFPNVAATRNSSQQRVQGSNAIVAGNIYFLYACWIGTTQYIYLNGVLQNSGTFASNIPILSSPFVKLCNRFNTASPDKTNIILSTFVASGFFPLSKMIILSSNAFADIQYPIRRNFYENSPLTGIKSQYRRVKNPLALRADKNRENKESCVLWLMANTKTVRGTNWKDLSSGKDLLTINGGVQLLANFNKTESGNSVSFDGSTGYAQASTFDPLSGKSVGTFSLWFKTNQTNNTIGGWQADTFGDAAFAFKTGFQSYTFSVDTGSGLVGVTVTDTAHPSNKWHHLVGVYDGSNIYLYVDGLLQGSAAQTGNIHSSSGGLLLGRDNQASPQRFLGSINDIRAYSKALTAEQVLRLYNKSKVNIYKGELYGSKVVDDINYSGVINISLITKPVSPKSKPPRGSKLKLYAYAPNKKPILRFLFNEGGGSVVNSISGNGPGIIFGNPKWIPSIYGSALSFNGSTSNYIKGSVNSLAVGSTIGLWIRPTSTFGFRTAFAIGSSAASTIFIGYTSTPAWRANRNGATTVDGGTPTVGKWDFVVATFSALGIILYVNGISVGSTGVSSLPPSGLVDFTIATSPGSAGIAASPIADIASTFYFQSVLTSNQIYALYSNPYADIQYPIRRKFYPNIQTSVINTINLTSKSFIFSSSNGKKDIAQALSAQSFDYSSSNAQEIITRPLSSYTLEQSISQTNKDILQLITATSLDYNQSQANENINQSIYSQGISQSDSNANDSILRPLYSEILCQSISSASYETNITVFVTSLSVTQIFSQSNLNTSKPLSSKIIEESNSQVQEEILRPLAANSILQSQSNSQETIDKLFTSSVVICQSIGYSAQQAGKFELLSFRRYATQYLVQSGSVEDDGQ